MNAKNLALLPQGRSVRMLDRARAFGTRVGAGLATVGAGIGSAMASGGGGVDTSTITATFDEYKAAVIALVIAFAVVLWAIRGAGLLKPR